MSDVITAFIQKRGEAMSGQLDKASENLYKEWEMQAQEELAKANRDAVAAQGKK